MRVGFWVEETIGGWCAVSRMRGRTIRGEPWPTRDQAEADQIAGMEALIIESLAHGMKLELGALPGVQIYFGRFAQIFERYSFAMCDHEPEDARQAARIAHDYWGEAAAHVIVWLLGDGEPTECECPICERETTN